MYFPVTAQIDGSGEYKECFKVEGVRLPTGYFLGLSAATGELSDAHDIMSIKLEELFVIATDSVSRITSEQFCYSDKKFSALIANTLI